MISIHFNNIMSFIQKHSFDVIIERLSNEDLCLHVFIDDLNYVYITRSCDAYLSIIRISDKSRIMTSRIPYDGFYRIDYFYPSPHNIDLILSRFLNDIDL